MSSIFLRFKTYLKHWLQFKPKLLNADRALVSSLNKKIIPSWRQLMHLPKYLNAAENKIIKICLYVIVISTSGVGALIIITHLKTTPLVAGNYSEAVVGTARVINPIKATTDAERDLSALIFSGLMKRDASGELVPDLAENYVVSPDNKTYTFKLKSNLFFHDGTLFSASDVRSTATMILNPNLKSPLAANLKDVVITSPNAATVVFTLAKPKLNFLSQLTWGVLPGARFLKLTAAELTSTDNPPTPIGTGPFTFRNADRDSRGNIKRVDLEKNERYYQNVYLKSISLVMYADLKKALEALRNRDVDSLAYVPVEYVDSFKKSPIIAPLAIRLPIDVGIFFNLGSAGPLANRALRQALNLSLDQNQINAALKQSSASLPNLILASPNPRADFALAKKILDNNGWKIGKDGIRSQTVRRVTTKLAFTIATSADANYTTLATLLAKSWSSLGAMVQIKTIPKAQLISKVVVGRSYDALLYGITGNVSSGLSPYWSSKAASAPGLNLANYSTKEMDKALSEFDNAATAVAQNLAKQKIQLLLDRDQPAIFLYSPLEWYLISKSIYGTRELNIMNSSERFNDITNWYTKTGLGWR